MRIPFDIKFRPQIESGKYKVFAHEHEEQEARIVCWDNKGEYPIVALVDNEPEKFDKYGRVPGGNRGGEFSLFIVTPEPEMSEFENGMLRYLQDAANKKDDSEIVESTKEHSPKLLSLAKRQLLQSGELLTQEHHEKLMETLREECKKDMPRWKKCQEDDPSACVYNCAKREDSLLYYNGHTLRLIDLEKLPGFKEDESHE